MCGGTDLNHEFRKMLMHDLADGDYLNVEPGYTKQAVINQCVREFDNVIKRQFTDENDTRLYDIRIFGLQPSSTNRRLGQGCYTLNR